MRQLYRLVVSSILGALAVTAPAWGEPIGHCRFDASTLTFAGDPAEQARCLLQKVERGGRLKPRKIPASLVRLITAPGAPSPQARAAALARFPEPYRAWAGERATETISRTQAGLPAAYFVIHDTSTPFLAERPFPRRLDTDHAVNSFRTYLAKEPVAHIFLSRYGQIWAGHDFSVPWRATKLETRAVGVAARGRFVHIELMQPRRYAKGSTSRGDTLAPKPGFSREQYRQLAALYVYASGRARTWMIPAFHAAVDEGIPEAHDDPQNFELKKFARALAELLSWNNPEQALSRSRSIPLPPRPATAP